MTYENLVEEFTLAWSEDHPGSEPIITALITSKVITEQTMRNFLIRRIYNRNIYFIGKMEAKYALCRKFKMSYTQIHRLLP